MKKEVDEIRLGTYAAMEIVQPLLEEGYDYSRIATAANKVRKGLLNDTDLLISSMHDDMIEWLAEEVRGKING